MSAVDLSIIIVSYNTRELTLACLRSIFEQTTGVSFEVIVVDNASSDGSSRAIRELFPRVLLIDRRDNLGFAAANNLAAVGARGRYLLLLNPDTVVLDQAIQKLMAFAGENPEAGIWGGRTLFADGSLNPTSCWGRPTPWSMFCRGSGLSTIFKGVTLFNREGYGSWKRDSIRHVDIVTGCLLLISRELWQDLLGFDPAFFMYGEEADLCLRARKMGFHPMITPAATIIHYGAASDQMLANKLCRQAGTKLQLCQRHWSAGAARFCAAMLWLETATRTLGWSILAACGHRRAVREAEAWRQTWHRRHEWLSEAPAHDSTGEMLPAARFAEP